MLAKRIEKELNRQVLLEAESTHTYLPWGSWADTLGFAATVYLLYKHSVVARIPMLTLKKYKHDRGGRAEIPALPKPVSSYKSVSQMFQSLLEHEVEVTQSINRLVAICLEEKDFTTHNFLQWYVSEQIEEEKLAKMIMDKLKLAGNDKGGLYLFDRDIATMSVPAEDKKGN